MVKAKLFRMGEWSTEANKRCLISCGKLRTFRNRQQLQVENNRIRKWERNYEIWIEESKISSFIIL